MDWHRLFGLILADFFSNSSFEVEIEKDLSQKKQLLDVVVLRRKPGHFARPLPDGFEDLADHNLISFKSHQDQFDAWAVQELLGHYVNYRKQISPTMRDLLGQDHFRCYAVCARFPRQLSAQVNLQQLQAGVYECDLGVHTIRILVTSQLAQQEQNALMHLFSADTERLEYARTHYQQSDPETSRFLQQLLTRYRQEGIAMSFTKEDAKQIIKEEVLAELTPEELLERVPLEQRVAGLSPEQRVAGLSPEQLLVMLKAASNALSEEQIRELLETREKQSPAPDEETEST